MFEHFSEQARGVVVHAQQDARELGHDYVGTEHVLLGMLRQDGVALDAPTSLGMSWDAAREQVVQIVGHGPGTGSKSKSLPGSADEDTPCASQRLGTWKRLSGSGTSGGLWPQRQAAVTST